MFCKYCGSSLPDGVKFCPACGKPTPRGSAGAASDISSAANTLEGSVSPRKPEHFAHASDPAVKVRRIQVGQMSVSKVQGDQIPVNRARMNLLHPAVK